MKQHPQWIAGLCFWLGLWNHEWNIFLCKYPDSLGPGTVGIHGDPPQFFLNSAFRILVITLLHMFWGTVSFNGLRRKRGTIFFSSFLCWCQPGPSWIPMMIKSEVSIHNHDSYGHPGIHCLWSSCQSLTLCLLCQDKDLLLFNQHSDNPWEPALTKQ